MIQPRDDTKPKHEPFKIRSDMLALDEYLKIFILPQVPAEYKEFRDEMRVAMGQSWRALLSAAVTTGRTRQKHLVDLKVNMALVEVYLHEVRDVCYRGKEKRKLDKNSLRRFENCAKLQKAVMTTVWGWARNEDKKLDSSKTQKTAGLVEKEEV